jgi:hypothetical protein
MIIIAYTDGVTESKLTLAVCFYLIEKPPQTASAENLCGCGKGRNSTQIPCSLPVWNWPQVAMADQIIPLFRGSSFEHQQSCLVPSAA